MTELARAIAFAQQLDERAADATRPFEHGTVVETQSLPLVYDLNHLRVVGDAPDAAELAAAADAEQGASGHRAVRIEDDADGDALAPAFARLGWRRERHLVMAHDGAPPTSSGDVEEPVLGEMLPAWAEEIRTYPHGAGAEVVEQLVAARRRWRERNEGRTLALRVGGRLASWCDLYACGGVAQIEGVATLPEFRNRGLARAVVSHGLAEAAGADLVFLVADADDWPQKLYRKLGFRTIGRRWKFVRS